MYLTSKAVDKGGLKFALRKQSQMINITNLEGIYSDW